MERQRILSLGSGQLTEQQTNRLTGRSRGRLKYRVQKNQPLRQRLNRQITVRSTPMQLAGKQLGNKWQTRGSVSGDCSMTDLASCRPTALMVRELSVRAVTSHRYSALQTMSSGYTWPRQTSTGVSPVRERRTGSARSGISPARSSSSNRR
jgi:hypothetical protein